MYLRRGRLSLSIIFITLLACSLSFLPFVRSWGGVGHRVIANIANIYINEDASRKIEKYLHAMNVSSMVEIANWADEFSNEEGNDWSKPCHFIDCKNGTAPEIGWIKNCNTKCCASDAIKNYTSIMLTPSEATKWYKPNQHPNIGPKQLSQDALKFIIHYIGDIHQPLHVAYSDDRGGNLVECTFDGESYTLHKIWDFALINYWQISTNHCDQKDPDWNECDDWKALSEYVIKTQLTGKEGIKNIEKWRNTKNDLKWALETHSYVDACYDYASTDLRADYYYRHIDVVIKQLAKAGVRLAQYLEIVTEGLDIEDLP